MNVTTSPPPSTLPSSVNQPAIKATRRASSKAAVTTAARAPLQPPLPSSSSFVGSADTTRHPHSVTTPYDPPAASDFGGAYGYDDAGGVGLLSTGTLDADRDVAHLTGNASAVIPGSDITEGQFLRLSPEEQRKQRRLIRNRLSAHMHRQRQRGHIDAMETQVTELSFVVNEMRERLIAARNALARVASELPPSSSAAIEAAVTADSLIFAPGVLKYQPPREPGLLGFTGPTKDALGAIRNAVSAGLVGVGVKPMCMALNGESGGGLAGTQLFPSVSKPADVVAFNSAHSSAPPSYAFQSQMSSINTASLPHEPNRHAVASLPPGRQIEQSNQRKENDGTAPQIKMDSSILPTSNHFLKFGSASINSSVDNDLSEEGLMSNGSASPHSRSIPTDSSSPDTLEIGSSGKRTKNDTNLDQKSSKKSKAVGQSQGTHKKARISQSETGGGGSSSNTTASSSSSSSEDEMNPITNLTRSASSLSTSSERNVEAQPTLVVPSSTLSSSLIDFLPHKSAPIPLLLEVDDVDDDDEQEKVRRTDDIVNAVFNGVKGPSDFASSRRVPLPKLSFSRMPSFEVSSSSPLGGEDGFVMLGQDSSGNAARTTNEGGLSSPSPFVSMVRAGPFMRMDSFEPPVSANQQIPFTFVGRPTAASDASGISLNDPRDIEMIGLRNDNDVTQNGLSLSSSGRHNFTGRHSLNEDKLNGINVTSSNTGPPTSLVSTSGEAAAVVVSAPGTHSPKAMRALTPASNSLSIPQRSSGGSGNGGKVILSSSSPLALGAIALFGLIAVLSTSNQSSSMYSVPPGVRIASTLFSSFATTLASWKQRRTDDASSREINHLSRLLLSNEIRNAIGLNSAHSQTNSELAPLSPVFQNHKYDDSLLSRQAMLVLSSAAADFDKELFTSSAPVSSAFQSYTWPYSMFWSRIEGKNVITSGDNDVLKSSSPQVSVQREKIDTDGAPFSAQNKTSPADKNGRISRASLRASSINNKLAVSSQVRSSSLVDLSSIAAAGRNLGRSMAQMSTYEKHTEQRKDREDLSQIGRLTTSLHQSSSSPLSDIEGDDLSPSLVIERELKAALQTYAEAARRAYIQTQRRLIEQSLSAGVTAHFDHGNDDDLTSKNADQDKPSETTSSASFVLCPDAFGSIKGLSVINRQMKHSEVMSNDQNQEDNSPPIVGSNILPLPPPHTSSIDEESTMSHPSTTSAPPQLTSTPSSPPYLLLLFPSDSMAGRGLGSTMAKSSNLRDSSGHIKVELQGGDSNASTVSTASFPIKKTKNPQTTSSSASADKDREVKSGWIEVGCEVVSLRKISGVPVAS